MSHATCGFFNHPDDSSLYGATLDGLVAPGILLEIKTRAVNCAGPNKQKYSKQYSYQCFDFFINLIKLLLYVWKVFCVMYSISN